MANLRYEPSRRLSDMLTLAGKIHLMAYRKQPLTRELIVSFLRDNTTKENYAGRCGFSPACLMELWSCPASALLIHSPTRPVYCGLPPHYYCKCAMLSIPHKSTYIQSYSCAYSCSHTSTITFLNAVLPPPLPPHPDNRLPPRRTPT